MKRQRPNDDAKGPPKDKIPVKQKGERRAASKNSATLNRVEKKKDDDSQATPQQSQSQSQSHNTAAANTDINDDDVFLTPHTLRLLKLIQDGSREHAAMAALHLTTMTAQFSPLVLWDVLGRLQSFLIAPSWQTRHNASVAMQGVAKHLPPKSRQQFMERVLELQDEKNDEEVLSGDATTIITTTTISVGEVTKEKKEYLWLTLRDVQNELSVIVEKGRLLWAYAEHDQDTETLPAEEYLQYLDQQQLLEGGGDGNKEEDENSKDQKAFVQRRIEWQRRILAQRVGLSGLIHATGKGANASLMDTITSEDLDYRPGAIKSIATVLEETNTEKQQQQPKPKRRRRKKGQGNKADDESDVDETSKEFINAQSVRALLVLEMKREQSSSRNNTTVVSHDNPQTLLATELLYRVFDPLWHIRHGALLGLLSLLRAWHTSDPSSSSSTTATNTNKSFGAWPQDIMARCLCILVLDRFGDYSGTTTSAVGAGGSESGCVVAPVRETAGQLLSMVWLLGPSITQRETLKLLYQLAKGKTTAMTTGIVAIENEKNADGDRAKDWEIRHGALLALKYIVAVQVASESSSINNKGQQISNLSDITRVATECLGDSSDDVQSVAAQILSTMVTVSCTMIDDAAKQHVYQRLWRALARTRSMSSSILDLMNLCSTLLQSQDSTSGDEMFLSGDENAQSLTGAKILDIFRGYLDHDLMTVRLAALRSISIVVLPLWKAQIKEGCCCERLVRALDKLQDRLFVSTLVDCQPQAAQQETTNEEFGNKDDVKILGTFAACRSQAWTSLVIVLADRLNHERHKQSVDSIASQLLLRFFGITSSDEERESFVTKSQEPFPSLMGAADALSDVLWESSDSKNVIDLMEATINIFLQSPWTVQCEAACLLLRALLKKIDGIGSNEGGVERKGALCRALVSCRQSILTVLETAGNGSFPHCLAVEHIMGYTLTIPTIVQLRDSAFLSGIKQLQTSNSATRVEDAVAGILELWKKTILSKEKSDKIDSTKMHDVATTLSSMRLFATMAGVSLAGNSGVFPSIKATPIIRPIMTSLKNETEQTRLRQTSGYMVELLLLMFTGSGDPSHFLRAREKILSTMCDRVGASATKEVDIAARAFAQVIQNFVNLMAGQIDTLERILPVWLRLQSLLAKYKNQSQAELWPALNILEVICGNLRLKMGLSSKIIADFLPPVTVLACQHDDEGTRTKCIDIIQSMCSSHTEPALLATLPPITGYLEDRTNDFCRISGCQLLEQIVHEVGIDICPFVRRLLRIVMSLMADPVSSCAKAATSIFASLVRVAPLIQCDATKIVDSTSSNGTYRADSVVDHLIHGKPLPPYTLPEEVSAALTSGGISLRPYQMEGIAWLRFLQSVHLNGALCDSMGLGKTLQALVGVAIAHVDSNIDAEAQPKSLVICPSSVVGHWGAEIEKFFPEKAIFRSLCYIGTREERKELWKQDFPNCNIVVTSYSVLRSDADILSKQMWRFVILDEGHLLKNPKTATAHASRRLRAHHKLILTGTPVQNKVQEVFATFDFLMPNFLGSSQSFAKEFAQPITKGYLPGAKAEKINSGMEQLKALHQQVLPFILRREKSAVLKDLPPKVVTTVPCEMSSRQRTLYERFLATQDARESVEEIQRALQQSSSESPADAASSPANDIGSKSLKILLYLRLLCTHPSLVEGVPAALATRGAHADDAYDMSLSGKFLALVELLRACGIHKDEITGADNDTSLLYCNDDEDEDDDGDNDISSLLTPVGSDGMLNSADEDTGSKCLVFAQFTHSLDAVEDLLVKRHMPSLRYLRLDGRVPATKRTALVDAFNNDPSIKLMLLTTRVGGLGLNLTGADTVIFLENDYNPFADLQAADRAHRIGQAKTVNVYRLVTKDSIEEKIMSLQEKKIALSNAIVNTDNSSLFSMGTDRLLDIFTCRSQNQTNDGGDGSYNLDALVESYKSEYSALSVNDFLQALQK